MILRVSSGDVLSSEKRLGLEISLYQILQISNITMLEKVAHLTWIESQLHQLLTASAKGQQAAPAPPLDIPDLGF